MNARLSIAPVLVVTVLLLLVVDPVGAGSDYEAGFTGATRTYDKSAKAGDPISMGSGAFHTRLPLVSPGGPMGLGFELL